MNRERWVIKTNKNRYVSIPFILSSGFKSYLDEIPEWNKTATFHSQEEAEKRLNDYLSPKSKYYIDQNVLMEGEKLIDVEKVIL